MHHIEVFECSPDLRTVPDYSGSCDDKMKPDKLDSCRHVLAAWAMGAEVRLGDAPLSASQINVLLFFLPNPTNNFISPFCKVSKKLFGSRLGRTSSRLRLKAGRSNFIAWRGFLLDAG